MEHPFYESFSRFVEFGLLEGNDQVERARFEGRRRSLRPWSPFLRYGLGWMTVVMRTWKRCPRTRYSLTTIPAALVTGFAFMTLAFVGEWIALFRPGQLLRSRSESSRAEDSRRRRT